MALIVCAIIDLFPPYHAYDLAYHKLFLFSPIDSACMNNATYGKTHIIKYIRVAFITQIIQSHAMQYNIIASTIILPNDVCSWVYVASNDWCGVVYVC